MSFWSRLFGFAGSSNDKGPTASGGNTQNSPEPDTPGPKPPSPDNSSSTNEIKSPFKIGKMLGLTGDKAAMEEHIAFIQSQITSSQESYETTLKELIVNISAVEKDCEKTIGHFQTVLEQIKQARGELVKSVRDVVYSLLPDEIKDNLKESVFEKVIDAHEKNLSGLHNQLNISLGQLSGYAQRISSSRIIEDLQEKYMRHLDDLKEKYQDEILEFKKGYTYGSSISDKKQ